MKSRPGYTLIEMLAVISLIGLALGTVALTLHALRSAERRISEDILYGEAAARLTSRLRSDAHLALSASLPEEAQGSRTLQLSAADGVIIEYSLSDRGVDRRVRQQENVQHRETFVIPISPAARWEIDGDRPRPLGALWLPPVTGAAETPRSPALRLLFAVGIHEPAREIPEE